MAHPTIALPSVLRGSVLIVLTAALNLFAAEPAPLTGSIEGRVINSATDTYIEGVRITMSPKETSPSS